MTSSRKMKEIFKREAPQTIIEKLGRVTGKTYLPNEKGEPEMHEVYSLYISENESITLKFETYDLKIKEQKGFGIVKIKDMIFFELEDNHIKIDEENFKAKIGSKEYDNFREAFLEIIMSLVEKAFNSFEKVFTTFSRMLDKELESEEEGTIN